MRPLVHCDCGHRFEAEASAAGGYVNCPRCGKAVAVGGLRDPLWRLLQGGALLLWLAAVYVVSSEVGILAGVAAGFGLAGLLWLLSRAL